MDFKSKNQSTPINNRSSINDRINCHFSSDLTTNYRSKISDKKELDTGMPSSLQF